MLLIIKIIVLEENKISLLTNNNKIIIKGNNLVLKKLLDKEILINGKLLNIEVLYD